MSNNLAGARVYVMGIATPGHERHGYYGKVVTDYGNSTITILDFWGRTHLEWRQHVRLIEIETRSFINSIETHLL